MLTFIAFAINVDRDNCIYCSNIKFKRYIYFSAKNIIYIAYIRSIVILNVLFQSMNATSDESIPVYILYLLSLPYKRLNL